MGCLGMGIFQHKSAGNVFSIKTCRFQNPDIPRAGWDGAAHLGGDGQDGTTTGRFAQETTDLLTSQTIEEIPPGRVPGSTNNRRILIRGTTATLRPWMLNSRPSPF